MKNRMFLSLALASLQLTLAVAQTANVTHYVYLADGTVEAFPEEYVKSLDKTTVTDGGIQATGYIEVYALDGRLIAEGNGFVALDKGVYVVRIHGVSTKVIVK